MRRPRLELSLIGLLGLVLVGLLVFQPEPGARDRPQISRPQGSPCGPALRDAPSIAPPDGTDVESVAAMVERLRDLRFEEIPEPTYVTQREIGRRLAEELSSWEEDADVEARVLELLGAVPPGYDLLGELRELAEEQVLGFYDPATGELVVRRDAEGEDLRPDELLTLAHELGHALADQAVGFPDLETLAEEDPEGAAAARALVEGDAMILTFLYASSGLSFSDQLSLAFKVPGTESLEGVPHFIVRSVSFPYTEGLTFACALYEEGGWGAVDRAYGEPPTTTAHIVFPERYLAREEAEQPTDPAGLSARWTARSPRPLGAADLLFLFEAPGDDPARAFQDPHDRAGGWDGGALHVWTSGEDVALSARLVQRDGGADLCSTVAAWYRRSFEVRWEPAAEGGRVASHDRRAAALRCEGGEVTLGIAPDADTAVQASG